MSINGFMAFQLLQQVLRMIQDKNMLLSFYAYSNAYLRHEHKREY